MKTIKVTKLEKQVLEALASGMYTELGYSDVNIQDIQQWTGLDRNVIRGVAGSLQKKKLIDIDYSNTHIWYLTELTYGLVDKWVGEKDWLTDLKVEKIILEQI